VLVGELLAPYPDHIYRITHRSHADLGEFLPFIGAIKRHCNPKDPDYYDWDVDEYMRENGMDPTQLNKYVVVPKRVDLAENALMRYNRIADPFSDDVKRLYDIAGDWLEKEFGPYLCNSEVLSYTEVLEWLRPDKSPGSPWSSRYPFKGDYWSSDDADFFVRYFDLLATPDYIRSLCSVSIKEEVREKLKVDNGEVRTIIAMDVNHVVAHSMLCLDQNRRLIQSHLKHSIALGLDMFNGGWNRLNTKMTKFGSGANTLELDGKKFDGKFRYYVMRKIYDFRKKMLRSMDRTPENCKRLDNLCYELLHSPLVNVDGCCYGRVTGNPSGQGSTTPDNSFKNFMDIVVLWHLIMPKEFHTYEIFKQHINLCIVGDDINIECQERAQLWFNANSIQANMSKIDMQYTFASMDFRRNHECTFLGHGFSLVDEPTLGLSMYFPVIDCEKMRSNMLIDNVHQTPFYSIVRACGLRNETFACVSCRKWFLDLINHLRSKYQGDSQYQLAFKNFLTDRELWKLYSGFTPRSL
jgi:hypothetical protein